MFSFSYFINSKWAELKLIEGFLIYLFFILSYVVFI